MIGCLDTHKEINKPLLEGETIYEFGSLLPYTEPQWYQGQYSPYYKESHAKWRNKLRKFIEEEVKPITMKYKDADDVPRDVDKVWVKSGTVNIILGMPWNSDYNGIKGPEDFDLFH